MSPGVNGSLVVVLLESRSSLDSGSGLGPGTCRGDGDLGGSMNMWVAGVMVGFSWILILCDTDENFNGVIN
jgi:hypothetical protein